MENVVIDWQSEESSLFLNPRLAPDLRDKVVSAWEKATKNLTSHVGLLTSGSSGSAKLVLISKRALLAAAEGANLHLVSGKSDTWLKTLPHFHVGGLSIYARAHLSGARVVKHDGWSAKEVYDLALREKITLISLVPAQLFDLITLGLSAPPTLRAAIIGGGALQPELYNQARALSWPVVPSYGLTECGSQVATAVHDSYQRNDPTLKLLPHISVQLSEDGKLMVKSDALLTAYVNVETGEVSDPKVGGWFTTEDVGELKAEQLIIKGRSQDFLKIGGESVDFAALEKVFSNLWQELGFKGDAALLPVPDHRLGATVVLVVDGLRSDQAKSLVEKFNALVMPYERIRHICNVPKIPRSELGKVLRSKAIEMYSELS